MTELELKIQKAAQDYYTTGTSEYTDEEFDALVDLLRKEQPDSELFKVGWGYKVSEDSTPGTKRDHKYTTIGSLDKCHNMKEIGSDFLDTRLDISVKLDGLSIVLYYENDGLKYALTRGDGHTGIDVTDKILKINPSFSHTVIPFTGAIRGEILMTLDKFEEFKKIHPEAKNPRNSTAGIINGKDTFNDLSYLDVVLYTLVHESNDEYDELTTVNATRNYIDILFKGNCLVVPYLDYSIPSNWDDEFVLKMMTEIKNVYYGNYPADGLVLTKARPTCVDGTYQYDAKAFKFPAESKITKVIDVEWNMSKTKYAVPRVLLEPVELSGTTVQACTGFNAQYILDNHLGPGSMVEVCKSGEIIPYILKVISSTHEKVPEICPECSQPLSWNGVHLFCTNQDCCNSVEQDLLIWLKNLVPLDNLGDTLKLKFLRQMVDSNQIVDCSVESVMNCKTHLDENTPSVQFNNFAKMWNNLHDESVKFDLTHALIACNIPRIGDLTAIKFTKYSSLVKDLVEKYTQEYFPWADLTNSIGDANCRSVHEHLNKLKRLRLIINRIKWKDEHKAVSKGKVAITGKLSVPRASFEEELRRNGWEPTETINKDVKFLLTENPQGQSSKNLRASKLGITKITEYDFRLKYLN